MTVAELLEALKGVPLHATIGILSYPNGDVDVNDLMIETYYLEASNTFVLDEIVRW